MLREELNKGLRYQKSYTATLTSMENCFLDYIFLNAELQKANSWPLHQYIGISIQKSADISTSYNKGLSDIKNMN